MSRETDKPDKDTHKGGTVRKAREKPERQEKRDLPDVPGRTTVKKDYGSRKY